MRMDGRAFSTVRSRTRYLRWPGLFHLWLNAVLTRAPVETRVPAKAPKTVHFRHHAKASRSPFMKRGGLGCLPQIAGEEGFEPCRPPRPWPHSDRFGPGPFEGVLVSPVPGTLTFGALRST